MKEQSMIVGIAALALVLAGPTLTWADSNASSNVGGGMPSPDKVPTDKRTDMTGGQTGVPDEYSTTPVRQGSLKEVTDSKWMNRQVTNKQGEKLGTIKKVLKDEKTQNIEYVFFEIADSRDARPMKWSSFEQKGDKLVLNMTKEQLLPSVNRTDVKDMSPDLAQYMEEIEQKRAEPKGSPERPSGAPGSLSGASTMGEDQVGPHRAPPRTPAPGFENEGQKGKKQ